MRGKNEMNGRTKGLGTHRRLSALGLGSGAAVVALVMMLSPIAAAHTPVTYTAPYLRSVVQLSSYTDVGGCAKLTATKLHFSAMTGMGTWAAKATAKSCKKLGPIGGSGFAYSSGQALVGVPIKTFHGAATPTTVAVTWTVSAMAAASASHTGSCPPVVLSSTGYGYSYCSSYASASVYAFAYMIDLTNGSYFYPSNYPQLFSIYNDTYNDTYCYSFTCYSYNYSYASATTSFSGSSTSTWWINGTLNHADKYAVVTYVDPYVDASSYGYPGASAVAYVDMASTGNGFSLASIVVS
jgi:hypothetical protein